jgi:hypothetical protein
VVRKRYREQFEQEGIDEVRAKILRNNYQTEQHQHAKDWIAEQDAAQARSLSDEQIRLMREQASVARSANRAAWIAAITAIIAAIIAIASIPTVQTWISRLIP